MRRFRRTTLALLLLGSPLAAHDLWLEPSSWRPEPGSTVELDVVLGEGFRGRGVRPDAARPMRLASIGADGIHRISMLGPGGPLARTTAPSEGSWILAYDSGPFLHRMSGGAFTRYLMAEGLDAALALRSERGESRSPGRERYRRCVKALLAAGTREPVVDRRLGMPFELLLESVPTGPAGPARLRVLFRDEPITGVLVTAIPRVAPEAARTARSDSEGRVRFDLDRRGPWLVRAVHMTEASEDAVDAEWESWWASLTFENPGP